MVVGAGLAGLTAAYELAKHSIFDVRLIEARDRVGGRVLSRVVKGTEVDLGGFLIFPWYRHYHRLSAELGLDRELHRVPLIDVYFDMGDRKLLHPNEFDLRLSEFIAVAAKSMASSLLSGRLEHPNLDHYDRRTIEACIDSWSTDAEEAAKYRALVDTLCQGYCYPPIRQYKAAFGVPIYPRTVLLGDATHSEMFRHGSRSLSDALLAAFAKLGGEIRLGCEVTGFDGEVLESYDDRHSGDVFVFAQNADHPLMRDLVPRSKPSIRYTRFATAVVSLRESYQPQVRDWGAIFFAPVDEPRPQVLSMIHLERLYDAEALRHDYTVNIRLPADTAVDDPMVIDAVSRVCSQCHGTPEVVTYEVWPQTMPVSDELFVESVRALQGVGDCFFAGDYLGCPSMEVAVATGLEVAQLVYKRHRSSRFGH